MLATPLPGPAETYENASFEALLWALSRPGLPRSLPASGEAPIIAALLDRECLVYTQDPLLLPEIMQTGAEIADVPDADYVFLGAFVSPEVIGQIAIGSDLYPDDGATVVVRATLGTGSALRLTGPGVDGAVTAKLGGLPEWFWAARAARLRYPMGFDLLVSDGTSILGIPRSTTVEVL